VECEETKPVPQLIFVLGIHRSGTTWLANLLCNHPQIQGVQHTDHFGIVESWYFSHLDGCSGDLNNFENYKQFLSIFSKTEYFRCSNLPLDPLLAQQATTYRDTYLQFVTEICRKHENVQCWLEKTPVHTLYIYKLKQYYPDALFIAIQRPILDVMRSGWQLRINKDELSADAKPGILEILRQNWRWAKYNRYLETFHNRFPGSSIIIQYADLRNNPEPTLRSVLQQMGIAWDEAVLKTTYARNTSFQKGMQNQYKHSQITTIFILLIQYLMRLIPFQAFALQERLRKPRHLDAIPYSDVDKGQYRS